MKVCNKIIYLLFTILAFLVVCVSCKTKNYVNTIFNPNIDKFAFKSLSLKDAELIKLVVQTSNASGVKAEFENGNIILLSDFHVEEANEDCPPNFVTVYEYDDDDRLKREKSFINFIAPHNLINESSYEYNGNMVKKIVNNSVFSYELKQKQNGYEMYTENINEKLKIMYRENNKYKKMVRVYNERPENETVLLIKKGKEFSFSKADFKNEKCIVYFYQEVTKYEGNLIKEIMTYDVNKNGEKTLNEIIVIEKYDEHGNWTIAKVYDGYSNLKNIYKQDISYLK